MPPRIPHFPPSPPRGRATRGSAERPRTVVGRALGGLSEGPSHSLAVDRDRTFRHALVVADVLAALLALWIAAAVGGNHLHDGTALIIPLVVLVGRLLGLYGEDDLRLRKSTLDEAPRLFQLATISALAISIGQSLVVSGPLGGDQILGVLVLLLGLALVGRGVARAVATRLTPPERCLLVGGTDGAHALAGKMRGSRRTHVELVADEPLDLDRRHPDDLRQLEEVIRRERVERVVLAPRATDSDFTLDAVRLIKSLGVKVSLLPRLFEVVGSSVVFDDVDGTTVLGVRQFGLSRSSRALKRVVDVLGAVIGLICVAPAMLVMALLILHDSPGPVLFRQTRVGRGGREFNILKFRTMVVNAEARKPELADHNEVQGLFKMSDDPRVTRVGRFLRRTSLDELPQLLNVLAGDMSLVGPRPLIVDEDRLVQGWHRRRLHLTPGMTGPWQVLGATRVPLQEMVIIDYLYVANWSLFGDVKVLIRTALHVLRRDGR